MFMSSFHANNLVQCAFIQIALKEGSHHKSFQAMSQPSNNMFEGMLVDFHVVAGSGGLVLSIVVEVLYC